jgi:hypothetical protein
MGKVFYYNEEHKYIKREGTPGNYTYIYRDTQSKEGKAGRAIKWLKDLKDKLEGGNKEGFVELLKGREDKMRDLSGDNKAQDKFISIVRQGLKQFNLV